MGFEPSKADDPDLWICKLKDETHDHASRFVDDVVAFSKKPMENMNELKKHCIMKGVGKPQCCLGGDAVDLPKEWEQEGVTTAFSSQICI